MGTASYAFAAGGDTTAQVGVGLITSVTVNPCGNSTTLSWGLAITPPLVNGSPTGGYCGSLDGGGASTNQTNITLQATTNSDVSIQISSDKTATAFFTLNGAACSWPGCLVVGNPAHALNTSDASGNLTFNTRRYPSSDAASYGNRTLTSTAFTAYNPVTCPCGAAVNRSFDFALSVPTGIRAGNHSLIVTYTVNAL